MTDIMNRAHRPSDNPKTNFVSANGGGNGPIIPMSGTGAIDAFDPASSAQLAEVYKTTHVDRAKAFSIRTHQMSVITAVVSVVGAVAFGVAGIKLVVVATVGYFIVWGWAFWQDSRTSPGGVARHHSEQSWREIRRMNRARVDAFRKVNGIEEGRRWRE